MNLKTWIKSLDQAESFLDAIANNPLDRTNYLVFADYLDENGTPGDGEPVRTLGNELKTEYELCVTEAKYVVQDTFEAWLESENTLGTFPNHLRQMRNHLVEAVVGRVTWHTEYSPYLTRCYMLLACYAVIKVGFSYSA